MTFNLPPGVTLADIDRLFEEADESQCLGAEDSLTETEPLMTPDELAAFWQLANEGPLL
jgi:hypothetical protein